MSLKWFLSYLFTKAGLSKIIRKWVTGLIEQLTLGWFFHALAFEVYLMKTKTQIPRFMGVFLNYFKI